MIVMVMVLVVVIIAPIMLGMVRNEGGLRTLDADCISNAELGLGST